MATMQGRPAEPMAIIEQLQQLDEVKPLAADLDAIPPDVDVLMLVHPQNLPDKTLFAIDQFVLKGGKALVFVDPLFRAAGLASEPAQPARLADRQQSRTAVQGLGLRGAGEYGRRRPPRRAAGRMPARAAVRGRSTTSPGSTSKTDNLNRDRHDHRRSEPHQ